MQPEETVEFLHHLADLAALETLPHFRSLDAIDNKLAKGFDPVTIADKNAEKSIRNAIVSRWPEHGIIGEEYDNIHTDAEYCWVIDPIDGTRAFISGLPLWGTLIALCREMKPVAGIMSQPFTGERFVSIESETRFTHNGSTRSVATSAVSSLDAATFMTTSPDLFKGAEYEAFSELLHQCKMTRYGADCYAYSMVAAGQVELVVESGLNFFDIAALIPIVEGAGGIVTDWSGNPHPQGGQVIAAANTSVHREALTILKPVSKC